MNEVTEHIVDFTYCQRCKHSTKREDQDPCHDCLNRPTNTHSHRPVYFEEEKTKSKRKERTKKKTDI